MRILLTGSAGQLGRELNPMLDRMGDVTCVDRVPLAGAGQALQQDLSDLDLMQRMLDRLQPELERAVAAAEEHYKNRGAHIGRVPGWTVQCVEQQASNILIRPLTVYNGPAPREYLPLAER